MGAAGRTVHLCLVGQRPAAFFPRGKCMTFFIDHDVFGQFDEEIDVPPVRDLVPSLDNPLPCQACASCCFWQTPACRLYCGHCRPPKLSVFFSVKRWLFFAGDPETEMRWWEECLPQWRRKAA